MSLTNEEVARFFAQAPVRLDGDVNLRVPQIARYEAARDCFAEGGHRAVEQIPVECCETGLITLLPFDEAHIVVTSMHQLAERADRWLPAFGDGFVDLIVVDEGHHCA